MKAGAIGMDGLEFVHVDKDILDFLKVIYFGDISDPIEATSTRAYRDFNRTIRYGAMTSDKRNHLRKMVTEQFRIEIPALVKAEQLNQRDYDIWHYNICTQIRTYYQSAGVEFTYGQAQKWLNMTIKYLYICGEYTFDNIFQYLHVPVDNYIISVVKKELGISCPKISWSRWDDYHGQYMRYQLALRSKIVGYPPLRREFKYWMQEARNLDRNAQSTQKNCIDKLRVLQNLQEDAATSVSSYYRAMEQIQAIVKNYTDYMTTSPVNCDSELLRLPSADYDLTCALMTMLLREDHFCNGAFQRRLRAGQVEPVLQRMVDLLSTES